MSEARVALDIEVDGNSGDCNVYDDEAVSDDFIESFTDDLDISVERQ